MGKLIRRTITITITETWTIVWAPEDDHLRQATTVVQDTPNPKEEPNEALQTTLSDAEPGKPTANEPTPPNPPAAATDPQPDDGSIQPAARVKSRRTRRRRDAGSNQRND